ncbi:ABC transporter substrate-binding protein [Atopobium sp. oral taxon 416]|uniref:ABC transporter substrate-binding protein n=1 Tax=Atopobium sp. oral taxon 416 TaxID=712157 RepID=UPI002010E4C7
MQDCFTSQVTFVPNPNWWGRKPKLNPIIYKQMESQVLFNAFKNGEVDATGESQAGSQEILSNFSDMSDVTIRRANSLSISNIEINMTRPVVNDIAVRKALYQCIDSATVRNVIWQGVNWDEETPGSLLSPAWADGYEDNRPDDVKNLNSADDRIAAAKQTLEDAGYMQNDDGIYEKDGQPVTFGFTTFGDSNTVKNRSAAIQKMAKDAGMDIEIDSKPPSEFSKTLTSGDWDIVLFGWVASNTYLWNAPQIYGSTSASNFTHAGSEELDEELSKIITIEDHAEQCKALNEVEKKCQQSYAFIPIFSGPDVVVTKANLANYGPALFQSLEPTAIGWQNS